MADDGKPADLWQNGTTLWYDETKRYGFVARDDGGNAFLHLECLQNSRIRPVDMKGGLRVRFTTRMHPGKPTPHITKIAILD